MSIFRSTGGTPQGYRADGSLCQCECHRDANCKHIAACCGPAPQFIPSSRGADTMSRERCVVCGEDEPFTGTCGGGDSRALCKQAASSTQAAHLADDGSLTYAGQRKVVEHMTTELGAAIELLRSVQQRAEAIDCQPLPASSTTPASGPINAWIGEMKLSSGTEYYVCVGRDTGNALEKTYLTPQKYLIRGRAEYDVACWNHMLNGGPEPDILAFDTDAPPAAQEGAQGERECPDCGADDHDGACEESP